MKGKNNPIQCIKIKEKKKLFNEDSSRFKNINISILTVVATKEAFVFFQESLKFLQFLYNLFKNRTSKIYKIFIPFPEMNQTKKNNEK